MRVLLAATAALVLLQTAHSQPATPAQRAGVVDDGRMGTIHMKTHLGSFKMIDGVGRVEVSFTGSMMLSGVQGNLVVSGNLKKQYEGHKRVVYFGIGKIVLTGKFRSIQWFGKNMDAVWFGRGVCRIVGEFDKNLYTGDYWYDDPNDKNPWYASGTVTIVVPQPQMTPTEVKPRARDEIKPSPKKP